MYLNHQRAVATAALPVLSLALVAAAGAAKSFTPPTGWDHVDQPVPAGSTEKIDQWKQGSGDLQQTITVLTDPAAAYSDVVGRIHKNVADAKLHVNTDKDQTCDGKTAHMIELVYGPEAKRVKVDRWVVPDGAGTVQITYTRPEAEPFPDDVKGALAAYCGSS